MLNSFTNPPTNPNPPTKGRDMEKDALERLDNWVNVLEKRIHALLDMNDPESMSPAEREQAANRHLMILRHFLQLRQEYAVSSDDRDEPDYVQALIHDKSDFDMESSY